MQKLIPALLVIILISAFTQSKKSFDIEGKWKLRFNADCLDDADSIWLEKYQYSSDTVPLILFRNDGSMKVYSHYLEERNGGATKVYGKEYGNCIAYNHKTFYLSKHNTLFFHWVNQSFILTQNEIEGMTKEQLVKHFNDLRKRRFSYNLKANGDGLLLVR